MMKKIILLFVIFITFQTFSQNAEKEVDFSSYEIAKKFQKDKKYVLAYKHLVIFKISNLERLSKRENEKVLKQIDSQISEFESFLEQSYSLMSLKKVRAYSEKELDSLINSQKSKIIIDEIKISIY